MLFKLTLLCVLCFTVAQDYEEYQPQPRSTPTRLYPGNEPAELRPTPVPILKQINRHNEDGSYTYGYEGADGAFKIETKLATGEVKGKYGYVDETGKVRVVEYGANKYGFQPFGDGITVAPPTLVDETTNNDGLQIVDYEDDQQPTRPVSSQKSFIARIPKPQKQQRNQPRFQPQSQPQLIEYQKEQQFADHISSSHSQQFPNTQPIDVVYSARQRPSKPDSGYTQTQTFFPNPHQEVSAQHQEYEKSYIGRSYSSRPESAQGIQYSVPGTQPVPVRVPHQPQQEQQQFQPQKGRNTSILDQLAKDYALPPGGSPALHDISYSYY